ncbi:MAG TPA: lipoprotein [Thermoflexales bacterium]|nr:lipoprotein [Thermoflexales bacterium]HQW33960.1 lipoprotein [Thermoflexales bacterium]HQX76609.1 lipoprotein [Thermoflexales bacterium]HQZ23060.1 lipoprotein [Thermoflexales bacterium]
MRKIVFALLMAAGLAACSGGGASPAQVIEQYLKARAKPDVNQMIAVSCAAWEGNARTEAQSFQSLNTTLQDMKCSDASVSGDDASVSCTGKLLTAYNGETRERNLAERQFALKKEAGEWRMCGYK